MLLPYAAGDMLDELHRTGNVTEVECGEAGSRVKAAVPLALAGRLAGFRTSVQDSEDVGESPSQDVNESSLDFRPDQE